MKKLISIMALIGLLSSPAFAEDTTVEMLNNVTTEQMVYSKTLLH